ncbi:peptidoglycan-binding protein [Streptomyces iconiensis]|uniref:Peptidoglycan-binding protein n=1 Tax=Streptomyces iconiensis TaxID=1384038 RepID=A0ABT6ZZS5_9ACTN|nr:peptidoglycan-binding protein [Streptomyces iconiensis]MDJ1134337.1 peptidoglycan-binding protein [Streptomyces iconiensis]
MTPHEEATPTGDEPPARHGTTTDAGTTDAGTTGTGTSDPVPTDEGPQRRTKRPLRASLITLAAITAVGAAGVAATGSFGGSAGTAEAPRASGPARTAKVERTTLTRTETVDGTLGFGTPSTVQQTGTSTGTGTGTGTSTGAGTDTGTPGDGNSQASGSAAPQGSGSPSGQGGEQPGEGEQSGRGDGEDEAGIVTWLPAEGETLTRGETVYSVDEHKVPLFYGSKPFYRTMKPGTEGGDVETLEKNLSALGYSGFTADDTYTDGTADAVRDWQDDMSREETGTVGPGDAVVAPGARRVSELKTSPGALSGGEALTWTGTERNVTVDLEAGFEDLVEKGTKATVGLPDGGTVEAEVTDIGSPSGSGEAKEGGSEESGEGSGADEATLPVELKVGAQRELGRYQAASVDVTLKAETRKDVLAVPVNALLARSGGGYAVETTGVDGRSRRTPVKLGMFANGKVEVSGAGIKEGLDVGVPR